MSYTYTEMKVYNLSCDECWQEAQIETRLDKRKSKNIEEYLKEDFRHLSYCSKYKERIWKT